MSPEVAARRCRKFAELATIRFQFIVIVEVCPKRPRRRCPLLTEIALVRRFADGCGQRHVYQLMIEMHRTIDGPMCT